MKRKLYFLRVANKYGVVLDTDFMYSKKAVLNLANKIAWFSTEAELQIITVVATIENKTILKYEAEDVEKIR